jgi:uncharacterized membrane protein YbaN (DUF454 family)
VNSLEAKTILLGWRPGHGDLRDAEVASALEQAKRDPALNEWLEQHAAFQRTVARSFQQIPVPADLRARILARPRNVVAGPWWRRPGWMAAAAAVVLLLGLAAWWFQPLPENSLSVFRSRMVKTVLRQYAMEIVTNDMAQVRAHLDNHRAPSNYVLPGKLGRQPVLGAGVLSFGAEKVSMVCLESVSQGTLFLFVVNRDALQGPVPDTAEFVQVSKLMTVTWNQGGLTYVLAGSGGRGALERYF